MKRKNSRETFSLHTILHLLILLAGNTLSGINCLHMSPGNDNRMQRAGSRHDRHHIPDDNEDNGKLLHAVMRPDNLGYTHIQ